MLPSTPLSQNFEAEQFYERNSGADNEGPWRPPGRKEKKVDARSSETQIVSEQREQLSCARFRDDGRELELRRLPRQPTPNFLLRIYC